MGDGGGKKELQDLFSGIACISGGIVSTVQGSPADLHRLKTGSTLCLCSVASPHKLWPGWPSLHFFPSFQPTRAVSCPSRWGGQWLTCHDEGSGIPQSHRGGQAGSPLIVLTLVMVGNPTGKNWEEVELCKHFLHQHTSKPKYMGLWVWA